MTDYRQEIETAAREFGLEPDLVEAVVLQESSGRADAFRFEPAFFDRYLKRNPDYRGLVPRRIASSYGLMQVMYPTARELGFSAEPEMLFVPRVSLHFGCMLLARLLKWAGGDTAKALAAYNGGKGNWTAEAPLAYAAKVLERERRIKAARG